MRTRTLAVIAVSSFLVATIVIGVKTTFFTPVAEAYSPTQEFLANAHDTLLAAVGLPQSCMVGSTTVSSGASKTFYVVPSVPTGETCESVSLSRTCTNGALTGSNNFTYANCKVASNLSNVRTNLKKFIPYVWSTTWYPWFNDTERTDPEKRGIELFKKQIPTIKEQGFNTVWLGGFAWFYLQPSPGVWNEKALTALKAHLDVLEQNNMRAIFQLNYVGPGYVPKGISGCTWMNDPAQVQKFNDFVTGLGGQLARYNYLIYYSVFTEQTTGCLAQRGQHDIYEGIRLGPDGTTSTRVDIAMQRESHEEDVHEVNQMLKQSVGRVTKYIPSAVRKQMYIGIHDAFVSDGQIKDDAPVENPIDFDFFSFPFYPNHSELSKFPSDSAIATSTTAYGTVFDMLEESRKNVRRFYPDTPLLLGEFGWGAWDSVAGQPTLRQDSPARNIAFTAMIDWSVLRKIGFNAWSWLPIYIDDISRIDPYGLSLSLVMPDSAILTSSPTLTTTATTIHDKLTGSDFGETCSWRGTTLKNGATVTAYKDESSLSCISETRTCTNGRLSGTYEQKSCTTSTPTTPVPSTPLSASCSTNGTQGTFSWSAVPGAIAYYLNVYDTTTEQYVKGPNAQATSPTTITTTPGHTYTSWFYAATSPTAWNSAVGGNIISCPTP